MCGILVTFDPRNHPEFDFSEALGTLRHRGPDDQGVYRDGPLAMGLQRLSILDLSLDGHQPMRLEENGLVLVFNGEIYSFREHRRHLQSKGVGFRSTGDTEVVARMLEESDAEALVQFNGMFALCAYFPDRQELLLARDRLGIKPLYFFCDGIRFAAASELKALFRIPFVPDAVNREAVFDFFSFGYIPGENSILQGVRRLPPATYARVRLNAGQGGVSVSQHRYWDLPQGAERTLAPAALGELVVDAVRRRTVADVPILTFLSGGIDSTVVATCLSRISGRPTTFTLGITGTDDERAVAAATAGALGTDHHSDLLTPAHDEVLQAFVEAYDEPFGDDSALPVLMLCRQARALASVALRGDGGDELFAGYDRYQKTLRLQRLLGAVPIPLARFLGLALERASGPWSRWNRLAWWLRQDHRLHYLDQVCKIHPRHASTPLDDLADWIVDAPGATSGWKQRLRWMQTWDMRQYLGGDILLKVDRASMHSSLEVRLPFLDHRLVEGVFRIPRNQLLRFGERKWILRQAFRDALPRQVLAGAKRGFGLPAGKWLRGPWKEAVLAAFERHRTSPHRILTDEFLSLLRRGFEDGVAEADKAAWLVFAFECWYERWGVSR